MDKLMPCPFCGSDNVEYGNDVGFNDEGFWEWIGCNSCGATAKNKELWNTRANEATNET